MRELEPLELVSEYTRQLKHAAGRQEDARGYLDRYPGRAIEHIWESNDERQRVTVDRTFLNGVQKVVDARGRDLMETGPQGEWAAEHILFEASGANDDPFAQPHEGEE